MKLRNRNKAEGAERSNDGRHYLPVVRGGQRQDYFVNYPHPTGAWIPKLDGVNQS